MKKILYFVLCISISIASTAQCGIEGAPEPVPPVDANTQIWLDGSNSHLLEIVEYSSPAVGFTHHQVVVTAPNLPLYELTAEGEVVEHLDNDGNQESGEEVIGVTNNGIFLFHEATTAASQPVGEGLYTFTTFAYNQSNLDSVATELNPILALLGIPPIPVPADIGNILGTLAGFLGPVTLLDVEDAICNLLPTFIDLPLVYAIAETTYMVNVVEYTGINTPNHAPQVQVYPTISTNYINIDSHTANVPLHIFNLNGELVQQQLLSAPNTRLDISHLANGIYIFSINQQRTKVIKY